MSADISELIREGLEHHQSGRLSEAEAIYRSVLRQQPRHPDALNLLGVVALQTGQADVAVDLFGRAIEAKPDEPEFHNMCGEAWRALDNVDKAIVCYEHALALNPEFTGAHNNLGNAYKELGRLEDAVACYQRAVAISPDFALSHNNLGIALRDLGRAEEARVHYERAVAIMPNYAEAHSNLGNVVQQLGRPAEAISHHQRALAIRPDYAEAHSNLGNALKAMGRHEEAVSHYNKALAIRPDFAMAHYNLGIALDEMGRPQQAIASYEQALALRPDYAQAHHNLGNALDEMGRREDAIAHFERALAIKPDYAEAHRNLSKMKDGPEQRAVIEDLLKKPSLPAADAIHCHFALGNIYGRVGAYDEAFDHYSTGNALKRKTLVHDAKAWSGYVDRLIAAYSQDYFRENAGSGSDSELPVFVLGMPRSGTTLVEQIVSSHPQVHGAGELAAFGRFERAIAQQFKGTNTYPECMAACRESVIATFSDRYLEELRNHSPDALRVTDKMPDNFRRIGLIRTLFPKARIIHCRRNALDTCVSNFTNYFATGNEYSFDLTELGRYYLDYERLMRHWSRVFPFEMLDVRYEELVRNQEGISRQLIEYLGLEWDDRCLAFHQNDRAVHNLSSMQVRQPIYAGSIDRWKHYEKHLAPLIALLSPPV